MLFDLALSYFGLFFTAGFLLIGALWLSMPHSRPMVQGLFWLYLTEFFIVGGVVVPALWGGTVFLSVMVLLGIWSLGEFYTAITPDTPLVLRLMGLVLGSVWLVTAAFLPLSSFPALLAFTALLSGAVYLYLPIGIKAKDPLFATLSSLIYPVGCFASLLLLGRSTDGLLWVVFAYAVLETQDTVALLAGKLLGKTKIFPLLSPGKTWAGVGWGLVVGLLVALVLGRIFLHWPWGQLLSFGLCVTIFTLVGDLVASKFKRDAQVKDFGRLIPSQGGILDIYDSLIFVAPALYLFHQVVYGSLALGGG